MDFSTPAGGRNQNGGNSGKRGRGGRGGGKVGDSREQQTTWSQHRPSKYHKNKHSNGPLEIRPPEIPSAPKGSERDITGLPDDWFSEERRQKRIADGVKKLSSKGWDGQEGLGALLPRIDAISKLEMETTDNFEEEWRRQPEIPSAEELMRQQVDLPTNVINGPFHSVDEYFETHFELIREDACSGLREAVCEMRAHPETEDTPAIGVYSNVRVKCLTYAKMGLCCKVSFSLNRVGKRIRWKHSKRLVAGTLVCVSDDEFQTIKVATVAARPLSGLEMDPPEVDLIFRPGDTVFDSSKIMVMVESKSSYYEAHKWTLRALQRMTKDKFPLHDHLCFLNNNIPPPDYVKKDPLLDLSTIFPDSGDKESLEEVDILDEWPGHITTSLDPSQLEALKAILTRRLAIIQGPPGTGKTYTSVLALRALLHNMKEDDPPIVVACHTNHALDQLLKYIQKHETNFVRLGGQTRDLEAIGPHTIYELRNKSFISVQGSQFGRARASMDRLRERICKLIEPLQADLLAPQVFCEYGLISEALMNSFVLGSSEWVRSKESNNPQESLKDWLGDSLEPIIVMKDPEFKEEEGDVEYETLQEMEADYSAGNNEESFDGTLKGFNFFMCRNYRVREPMGVTQEDIDEALKTENVWTIPLHLRAAMYCYLEKKAIAEITDKFNALNREYESYAKQIKIARFEKDYYIVARSKLVGMTTTGLSKYRSLVASFKPKIVLIEEAAESLEGPIAVGCLPTVEHLILVGDHKQLKAHCSVPDLEDDPYHLDMSMFERLIMNNLPYEVLREQRRMRTEFRELLTPIYNDTLKDHQAVLGRDPVPGMGSCNLYWWTHRAPETTDGATSKINRAEAEMVIGFAEYLILNGVKSQDITILTFYTGQRSELSKVIKKNINLKDEPFKVKTVDGYQGEENEIILLSLVRSNAEYQIGFLGIENRICVALSRAKSGFYIFGNAETVTGSDRLWWDVGKLLHPNKLGYQLPIICAKHKDRVLIQTSSDWIGLDGGCKRDCHEIMPCKHVCKRKCHSFDHKDGLCAEQCTRILPCGHNCENLCYEDCLCSKCGFSVDRHAPPKPETRFIQHPHLTTNTDNGERSETMAEVVRRAPNPTPSASRKSDQNSPASKGSDQNPPAPKRSDQNSPASKRSDLNSPASKRSDLNSPASKRSDLNPPTPKRPGPNPSVSKGFDQERQRQQTGLGFNTYDKPGRAGYESARTANRDWNDRGNRQRNQRRNTDIGMRDPEAEWRTNEGMRNELNDIEAKWGTSQGTETGTGDYEDGWGTGGGTGAGMRDPEAEWETSGDTEVNAGNPDAGWGTSGDMEINARNPDAGWGTSGDMEINARNPDAGWGTSEDIDGAEDSWGPQRGVTEEKGPLFGQDQNKFDGKLEVE